MSPRALPVLVIRVLAAGMLVFTAAGFLYIGTLTFQHWLRPPTQRLWAEAEVLRAQANRAWDGGKNTQHGLYWQKPSSKSGALSCHIIEPQS